MGFNQYQQNEVLLPQQLNDDNDATRQLIAESLTLLLGSTAALPQATSTVTPLQIVPVPGALSVTIGGVGQMVFAQQRIIDSCPAQQITITGNVTGSTRTDLISIQYQQIQIDPTSDLFDVNGATTTGTAYQLSESVVYDYQAGSTSPPAGFIPFATIAVPNGAAEIAPSSITYLIPTVQQLVDAVVGALVPSVNGLSGALAIAAGNAIGIDFPDPHTIRVSNEGVTSLAAANGSQQTGNLALSAGAGIQVAAVNGGFQFANSGITSFNGQTGDVALLQGPGIAISQANTNRTQIANSGVLSLNARTGAVQIVAGDDIEIQESSIGVFTISSQGVKGPQGDIGPAGPTGPTGPQGPQGPIGPVGPPGPQGPQGASITGPTGPQGARGLTGAQGAQGPEGPQGLTGPAGPSGGVGASYRAQSARIGSAVTTTVTLPPLPAGNYIVYAEFQCGFNSAYGVMTLSGSDAAWDTAMTAGTAGSNASRVELGGNATGGQAPSVTLTFGPNGNLSDSGYLKLTAWRVS